MACFSFIEIYTSVIVTSLQKASLIKGGCSALGLDVERDCAGVPGVRKIRSIQGFLVALFSARPISWLVGVEPLPGKDDATMKFGEGESSAFHAAIEMSLVPIVLADPHQPDDPIIFANGAFCELTGYDINEIVGRNCRFLQGPETDKKAVARIRSAVAARWNVTEELANYRKDGSLFWNALFVNPVFDRGGKLVYLFGTQFDVTYRRALEDALRQSHALLSVAQSGIAGALALPLSEAPRAHLDKAGQALDEMARRQLPLLTRSRRGG
jgi:PAS domain S-box-containing protein